MANLDQSDNESQPLVQPRNSASTPILPASEGSRSVESATVGNIRLEEQDLPPPPSPRKIAKEATPSALQGIEKPEALHDLSEGPVTSHKLSQNKRLEEHMVSSVPQAREDLEKHAASGDRSEEPAVSHSTEVRDAHNREAGNGGGPDISIDTQSKEVGGGGVPPPTEPPTVAIETPSITLLQGSSNFQISNTNIITTGGDATFFQFGDGQFTEVQRDLICDYISTLAALPGISDNLKKHILTQLIINLPRAEAVFNDYQNKKKSGPCFEGTRVALLREMANWVTSQDESRMYILSGLAGIGKSTVAYTIASRGADLNLLGASFFFSRDEADRNNAKKLFTTIAYQLCVYDERFAKAIGDVVLTERGSAATTKDPQEQLRSLILDPLRSIVQSRARPILIVVDALDECDENDVRVVVEGLSQLVRDLPAFKVILTTRPVPYFDYIMRNQGGHKLFRLQDIESKVVDGDIRLYLKYNLSMETVRERYPRRKWYASDEQIDTLVRAAGRLFIIASTTVRYILDKSASNPAAQMEKLLRTCAEDHTPLKDLDHFYTIILRNIIPTNCDDDIVCRYQSVVGAIIFIQRPLPVSALGHLIEIDAEEIHAVLEKLQSVILLGDNDVPRIYHKSFPDYLTDQARCKEPYLRIDPRISHTQIVTRCFDITNKNLKYNILGLGDVARYMSNEDGLKKDKITDEQQQEKISQQLRYACVYWANHLEAANIENSNIMNGLEKFVDEHILHWFEVLSLIGDLDIAHHAIRVVLKLPNLTSTNLHQLLSDALRFSSKFYNLIKRSALHTYHSALPFSPTDTYLYRRYIKEARHGICGIEGGPKNWDNLVANPSHGEGVDGIKFSLDSALFVSCSRESVHDDIRRERKLKIWDAATGIPISTIPGRRFAFTNDFSTIASSADNVITYYDVDGSTRNTMFTTSSTIEQLAFSESSRVAAALSDGTVWLWESRNGELIDSFDGFGSTSPFGLHDEFKPQLQFSPSGTRLVYSSANGILKLRDGISGRLVADLQCGSHHKFKFSGDGSRIASLEQLGDLALWSAESGGVIAVKKYSNHYRLAISATGSLVATAGLKKVTLWRENRGDLAKIEVLKSRSTRSLAFSTDSILAIGTYFDIKLYNTNTHSLISTLPFGGSLALSPGSTRITCGDEHGNMRLWDMRGIDYSGPPSRDETAYVGIAIALSRDCSRLACGFGDGTVELWETSPKRRIAHQPLGDSKIESPKRRITHQPLGISRIEVVEFAPDGGLFASGSCEGTIGLWNGGDGTLNRTLEAPGPWLKAVAFSNSALIAAYGRDVKLWKLDTLSPIHIFDIPHLSTSKTVSISDDGGLAAIVTGADSPSIYLVDVTNRTTIAAFAVSSEFHKLSFLPDNSQLIAQTISGDFLSHNLINHSITNGPTFEHLIQLPDIPLWQGVPAWYCRTSQQDYVAALFSQHQTPVPVLWIPSDIRVSRWTQRSSMIALACDDGHIILLRLPTSDLD